MSEQYGMLSCQFVDGGVGAVAFENYLLDLEEAYGKLCDDPNDIGPPDPVHLVMDNVPFHATPAVQDALTHTRFHVTYTCPWSCELMPMEYIFGYWKSQVNVPKSVTNSEGVMDSLCATLQKITLRQVLVLGVYMCM
jgi:hypothetical protein